MQGQPRACEAARELVRVAREGERRRGFDEFQVLQALLLMSRGPTGRPTIEKRVGIGEASAKTLLRLLRERGLASRCGASHCITEAGVAVARAFQALCLAGPVRVGLTGELDPAVIVVAPMVSPPIDVVDVYKIRDYLVARSCKPAIVGAYWPPDTLRFPGMPIDSERTLSQEVLRVLKESCASSIDYISTIVIAPARCETKAAAALIELVADRCGGHKA